MTSSLLKATPEPLSENEHFWLLTFRNWRWLGQVRAHRLHSGARAVSLTYKPQADSGLCTSLGASDGAPSPSCLFLGSWLLVGRPDREQRTGSASLSSPRAPHTKKGWGPPPPSPSRVDLYFVMRLHFGALAVHSCISERIASGVGRRQVLRFFCLFKDSHLPSEVMGCFGEQEPYDQGEVLRRMQLKHPSSM